MTYEWPTCFTSWDAEETNAMARVIKSGRFTMGPETEAFEHELAAFHGVSHCVAVNSGSSANLVACAALAHQQRHPLRPGDRVVVPGLAWATTYAPFVQHGLRLLVADCDLATWNVTEFPRLASPSDVAAVVSVPILGNPIDLTGLKTVCASHGIPILEDGCESLGASFGGHKVGTQGLMGTLSTFYSHQLSAIEGGAILTNSDECDTLCRMLRNHGWARGTRRELAGFENEYDFQLMGWNVRPLELHCAIAREQLKKLDGFRQARMDNWTAFWSAVPAELPVERQHLTPKGQANPFGIAFRVLGGKAKRLELALALRAAGIDCRPPVGGSFARHAYAKYANWSGETPNCDLIHDTGLFLGLAPFATPGMIERAVGVMKKVLA